MLVSYEDAQVLSPIFMSPKVKDGSQRVMFDNEKPVKKLNESVTYHHFKTVTLETAIRFMRPGCDLKDAYYSVPNYYC